MSENLCTYVYTRGPYRGQRCNAVCEKGKLFCNYCVNKPTALLILRQSEKISQDIAILFLLTVGLCDDYFFLSYRAAYQTRFRFFMIMKKLPSEVQSRICNLVYGSKKVFIPSSQVDRYLPHLWKK